ncbi:hypothetical protein THOM_1198 [Trachipleistophora hominis]|uniref:Uncharacterized protein n=1 Tax=Trachipleistophora hominis TaxID=72359 RepID=L7JXR6_TRAHO|nr:hypothetical protein THOM_1198 [Trachipleistophora hominis]
MRRKEMKVGTFLMMDGERVDNGCTTDEQNVG